MRYNRNMNATQTFTEPSTVHRVDHTGRGVQQGGQHGCPAVAHAVLERLRAADKPGSLNPRPSWYVASRQADGTFAITYPSR